MTAVRPVLQRPGRVVATEGSWFAFLCQCCGRAFRFQRIARFCEACQIAQRKAGVFDAESVGEVSGA